MLIMKTEHDLRLDTNNSGANSNPWIKNDDEDTPTNELKFKLSKYLLGQAAKRDYVEDLIHVG
jgi:hypothetical protein